ncbi:MAG: hypothetical protein IT177_02865 [Acidobacteria bacterium]|nr:hypothetical protein [Acidobacteriota bacterium]
MDGASDVDLAVATAPDLQAGEAVPAVSPMAGGGAAQHQGRPRRGRGTGVVGPLGIVGY